jgi:uncharacterized protein YoxC
MALIKIVLIAVALISILVFTFSVYFILSKKKGQVAQLAKTIHTMGKQDS